ncbi:MAG: hypothetical protein U0R44_03710 [Candidatus Micrarchaeia archaeon]
MAEAQKERRSVSIQSGSSHEDIRTQPAAVPISPELRAQLERQLNYPLSPGKHTVRSPAVGSMHADYLRVVASAGRHPEISAFATALYSDTTNRFLIPGNLGRRADPIARRLLEAHLVRYPNSGLTVKNAVGWADTNLTRTYVSDTENQWNTWTVQPVAFSGSDLVNGYILPRYIRAYHEFMHVEQTPPRAAADWDSKHGDLAELIPTIATIVLVDEVYKRVNRLPVTREVDHHRSVSWNGHSVRIGRMANFYRGLYERYGSWGAAVASPESVDLMRSGNIPAGAITPIRAP